MRLWSISPVYLDTKGLVACWSEGLLAQKVLLQGGYTLKGDGYGVQEIKKIKTPYYNHPQLLRFKQSNDVFGFIRAYLAYIWNEANERDYNFNRDKIGKTFNSGFLTVTTGQLEFEFEHLQKKLSIRCPKQFDINMQLIGLSLDNIQAHPLFKIVEGKVENWERSK